MSSTTKNRDTLGRCYDTVADEYARRVSRELDQKPFDRALLDRFADKVRKGGAVADVGCGPGHVARYLHDRGLRVCGLDLSARMLDCARRLHPGLEFTQADMRALPVPEGAWAGIIALYSIIHFPPRQIADTLREFARSLEPGASLLLSFHVGDEIVHVDEWWSQEVSLDFFFFQPDRMQGWLQSAGFEIEEVLEREPYSVDVEHQTRRCYIFARVSAH